MNKYKLKICGIKDLSILDCCIKNKVDYFGLIFYEKSPRFITLNSAIKLINFSHDKIEPVGVFVNKELDILKEIISETKLKYIQLHGNEDNNYIENLKKKFDIKIIRSIGIENKNDLNNLNKYNFADYFLFDYKAKKNELPGGNAKTFDWSLIHNIKINKPWFISGGIRHENVKKITNNLIPYGIDISSGVEEAPGIKSIKKIEKLIKSL